ncbi:hypothetical protein KZ829_14435 [Actinoplanes hulinensis]|uniref:Uncharacterized protein n=1 Tax=Actinoplanes hulinensis TaxID=1144547 RepID=A0ABS7B243_9ACTN|nr:hypothetical protein [Actinoplanes hulinensis]MBW6434937.1 hypothetical protein [Actinoplanes hulinensis]
MDVNTGGDFAGGPAHVVVELTAAEAANGATKAVAASPDGQPAMIYFPPGATDGVMLNVDLPWVDPATGTASTRTVPVLIRVLPAGAFPGYGQPPGPGFPPGGPPPGFPPGGPPPGFAAPARPRFSTRTRILAVAAGTVLLSGVLLAPGVFGASDTETTSGTTTTSTTTATLPTEEAAAAAAPPLDPVAFQASLDAADKELAAGVNALRAATTPRAVASAADALAEKVRTQESTLSALTAPAAASAAHGDLVSALSALADELSSVSGAAEGRSVCTGGSAAAALGRADAAAGLRAATAALAASDPAAKYRFGSFVPAVTKDQIRRKPNATYLTRVTGGSGQLKIDNGDAVDTVVKLVKVGSKKPTVAVYIRGNKKVTTGRIKDGTYQVFLASGVDWDGKRFTRECAFSKFDDSLKFTTTSRQYTIWELSLKEVLGGNASSSDVDPDEFPG